MANQAAKTKPTLTLIRSKVLDDKTREREEEMRVIAEIEYEVDDSLTLRQALKAIRDVPHGSKYSSDKTATVAYRKVITVKKEIKQ